MDTDRIYQVVRYTDRFPVGRVREVIKARLSHMDAKKLVAQLDIGLQSEEVAIEVDPDAVEKLRQNTQKQEI